MQQLACTAPGRLKWRGVVTPELGGGRDDALIRQRCAPRDWAGTGKAVHLGIQFQSIGSIPQPCSPRWPNLSGRAGSGRVEVVTSIDGRVSNGGVARYRQLEGRHLNPVGPRTLGPEVIALKAETRQSNLYISQAARTPGVPG